MLRYLEQSKSSLGTLVFLAWLTIHPIASSQQIDLPPGYRAVDWRTDNLNRTTAITFDDQGRLFAGQIDGCILIFEDTDHDGVADVGPPVAYRQGLQAVGGLAYREGKLYVSDLDRIITLEDLDQDGAAETVTVLLDGLSIGLHAANGLVIGPDDKLYVAMGSTCDICQEPDPLSATVFRMNLDGSSVEVFATGLRNVYDIAFNPLGDLFAGDNAYNFGAEPIPPDELNHVRFQRDYGWPDYHGDPPPGSGTESPLHLFPPHSSPDGIVFYDGLQFPGMAGSGFCALWGEWGQNPIGAEVVSFQLSDDGAGSYQTQVTPFGDGFIHPLDVVVGPEGSLFVADYGQQDFSRIYRVEFVDLELSGDASPGGVAEFTLRGNPGEAFLLFGSLGEGDFSFQERGRLRIEPLTMYRIFAGVFPGNGEVVLSAPIPDDPAFVGLTFYHQQVRLFDGTFYLGVRADLRIEN